MPTTTDGILSTFEWVVIHHSATPDGDTLSWHAIKADHQQRFGIQTQGYHWGVEHVMDSAYRRDPVVMRGASMEAAGVHVAQFNSHAVGICIVGDFDKKAPDGQVLAVAASLARWCLELIGRPGERTRVIGHRDVGLMQGHDWQKGEFKSCPGRLFDMQAFRAMVVP